MEGFIETPDDGDPHNLPTIPGEIRIPLIYADATKATGVGLKFDAGKPRMDLVDADALEELARVLDFGAHKYAEHNWRKGIKLSRLLAAAGRHLFAIVRGEDKDPETGLQHAAHLMCCAMFLIWTIKHKPDMDDRWKP